MTSCNKDFNIARLERYLTLAREAKITPVVVITKSDLTDQPDEFRAAAAKLLPGLNVIVLDARVPVLGGTSCSLVWPGSDGGLCRLIRGSAIDPYQYPDYETYRYAGHTRG